MKKLLMTAKLPRRSIVRALLPVLVLLGGEYTGPATLVSQPYKLALTHQGGNVSISWVGQAAQLEQASALTGPWVVVPGATSPFVVVPSSSRSFYRLHLPVRRPGAKLIRGYIAARVGDAGTGIGTNGSHDVYLPGIEVYLRDASSGVASISTLTDESGRFTLPATNNASYRICWQAPGFVSGCTTQTYFVGTTHLHVGNVQILPLRETNNTVVYGNVQMRDGSSPRLLEPLANINAFATVELLDAIGHSLGEAYVNNFGEYLLPNVPGNSSIVLRAKDENVVTDQPVFPEANLRGSLFQRIDLVIGNSPPRLQNLFATDPTTGRWLKTLRLGRTSKLTANATDPDGDPVKFRWLVQAGSGTLSDATGSEVMWTPPNTQGLYSVTVIAYDKKGGYARSTSRLRVDNLGVLFSGRVDATDGTTVAGAQIEVNGQITATASDGSFYFRVIDATRFVMNIRKSGYGLVSQIYDRNIMGGHWTLPPASVTSQDPTQPIDVTDFRTNCPGPLACQLNWTNFPQLAQPQWQDGSNNIVAPFDVLQVPLPGLGEGCPTNSLCGPGIRVQIPANSLVDQNGQVPTGNVSVQLSTIDLNSPFQMPGDFSVRTAGGVTNVMDSYGAGSITITAGTKKYNLIAGATAQVTIPIDPAQLAAGGTLPPVIPILFYNETQGLWVEDGTATLSGNSYVATVSHFSSINADTIKVNQSCVRIKSPSLPATYLLEYFIPRPGQAPKHNTVVIDNSVVTTHVIYNLPSSANIVLVPIRQTDMTPIGTFVVNTGAPQNPSSPNLPNDPPTYSACSTEVTLTDLVVPDVPNSGQFLHGLYTFEAANLTELSNGGADDDPVLVQALDQATQNYYQQIDPLGKRLTLDGSVGNDIGFKAANNFGGANDIEINVVYANGGDLGFGRNMHGVKKGSNTAAYVSNYGDIDSDDQTDANDAASPTAGNPVATVAMEYSPIENDPSGDRVVKFYVYNNLGNRVNSANLDKLGNRSVPQLCMVCHGGEYPGGPVLGSAPPFTSVADVKLGSNFLPFDLHYYKFPTTPSGFDKATQQPKFKDFNQMIVKISPPGPATAPIPDIINQMYLGGAVQDETFVVAGWKDAGQPVQESMYRDVISRSCRTCHAAHSFPVLNFDQASVFVVNKLASAESRVCLDHVMPHSKVTHKLFWTSVNPHQPAIFQLFGDTYGSGSGWNGTLCGNFTPGGQAVITPFTSTIQPIFNANSCLNCHVGSTPPPNNTFNPCGPCTTAGACQGLNLSVNAYANLVGHSSDEIPSVQRVKALDHANSYLWRKLDGTQISVGGCGAKMPLGGSLSPVDLNTIGNWIDNGAH